MENKKEQTDIINELQEKIVELEKERGFRVGELVKLDNDLMALKCSLAMYMRDTDSVKYPYANIESLKEVLWLFLSEHPQEWFKPSKICNELKEKGFVYSGTHFHPAVHKTLTRLADDGHVLLERRPDKRGKKRIHFRYGPEITLMGDEIESKGTK